MASDDSIPPEDSREPREWLSASAWAACLRRLCAAADVSIDLAESLQVGLNLLRAQIDAPVALSFLLDDQERGTLSPAGISSVQQSEILPAAVEEYCRGPSAAAREIDVAQFQAAQRAWFQQQTAADGSTFCTLAVPIVARGEVVGAWEFVGVENQPPSEATEDLLLTCGRIMGNAIAARDHLKLLQERVDAVKQEFSSELHDSVTQLIVGATMLAESLRTRLLKEESPSFAAAARLTEVLQAAQTAARRLAHEQSKFEIDVSSLPAAIEQLAQSISESRLSCRVEQQCDLPAADAEAATHCYRIIQEALQNSVRHAQASEAVVRIKKEGTAIVLEIEDDGVGFESSQQSVAGLGMQIMRYRARLIGARLEIDSQPGRGTRLRCIFSAPASE